LNELPVASVLDDVVAASRGGAVVVTAPPGSGKTMLVPAAVLDVTATGDGGLKIVATRPAAREMIVHASSKNVF
jgi:ATP-dependent helicase HrpB